MKMKYEKPIVEVIPFELNEAIASGCGLKVYNHAVGSCFDHTAEMDELLGMTGATLTDDSNCEKALDGYCYQTSNGTGSFLFNSN